MHSGTSFVLFRDWSLITGIGGGGNVKFYPYEKEGGWEKFRGSFTWYIVKF